MKVDMPLIKETNTVTLGKTINPTILHPSMVKLVGKNALFNLGMATSLEEGCLVGLFNDLLTVMDYLISKSSL